ncbi:MAG TPA: TRAP transporter small permease [Burkholderiaceae bacterium]|nr:TRAP transporter small permease [Burkholderiaceae bacterium]
MSARAAFVTAVDRLSIACAVLAAVLLLIAALVVSWSVIYRALGASTYWEIEFAVYAMVASVFLASPYCLQTRGHIGVDLLGHFLPPRAARGVAVALTLLGLGVCIYLAVAGTGLALDSLAKGERTESTWAPLRWPLYAMLPLGLALTALQYVAELLRPAAPAQAEAGLPRTL